MNTGFMNAFKSREGWLWWVHQHEERFVEMIKAGMNVQQVWPEKMVYGNYQEVYDLINWLGLEWPGKVIYDFIEPKLWHARRKMKNK